ncbi:MAG: hypothetical protein ACE5G9_12340 [Nitrospinales bacterium]
MKFVRSFLKLFFVTALGLAVWSGWNQWKQFAPVLDGLKAKDAEKYERMVAEFKDYQFTEARKLYEELQAITKNEVVMLRYKRLKEKWYKDEKFRLEWMKNRDQFRKKHRQKMEIVYKKRADSVERSGNDQAQWLPAAWQKMDSWKKSEMLREQCAHYLERDMAQDRKRSDMRTLSRYTILMKKPGGRTLTPYELCEGWVPPGRDERVVRQSLETLKREMGYFGYKEMLERLGIPVDKAFPFQQRFESLTGDLAG